MPKQRSFSATIVEGHKQCALEVPFDPTVEWASGKPLIRPGRRGNPVLARIGQESFESHVVARSKKFWLLLEADVLARLGVAPGQSLRVTLRSTALTVHQPDQGTIRACVAIW